MAINIRGRHYLKLLDYTSEEIRYLLDLSAEFKRMKRNGVPHRYLEGKNIVLLFEKRPPEPDVPLKWLGWILEWE